MAFQLGRLVKYDPLMRNTSENVGLTALRDALFSGIACNSFVSWVEFPRCPLEDSFAVLLFLITSRYLVMSITFGSASDNLYLVSISSTDF